LVPGGIEKVVEDIRKINPFAGIETTTFCKFDFELKKISITKFYLGEVKSLPRPDVNSMVIKSGKKVSHDSLQVFLKNWTSRAYRIKGFVNLTNGKTVAVQCTAETVELQYVEKTFSPTELIAISDQFTLREWNKAFKELS
jgi:G3E family GTPase